MKKQTAPGPDHDSLRLVVAGNPGDARWQRRGRLGRHRRQGLGDRGRGVAQCNADALRAGVDGEDSQVALDRQPVDGSVGTVPCSTT